MATSLVNMKSWTSKKEEEVTLIIKDWLKSKGRTQSDLGKGLNATSSRMPALIEILQKEYILGGMPYLAERLCKIEEEWSTSGNKNNESAKSNESISDPFGQLDLILKELENTSEENPKRNFS